MLLFHLQPQNGGSVYLSDTGDYLKCYTVCRAIVYPLFPIYVFIFNPKISIRADFFYL